MTVSAGDRLRRGLWKHCAVCGEGDLFDGWFRMKERCPACQVRFSREEGFFTGAVFVNFALTEIVMFAWLAAVLFATQPDIDGRLMIIGSVAVAIVMPVLAYPWSKTIWFAIHLIMQPLDPDEEADAAARRFERGDAAPSA
jgi:uncharacterized protein (DUF983 family)